jgi:ornithine cyclodeaminase/alanine dehydrogenase-like protein (mu-crystallin family)
VASPAYVDADRIRAALTVGDAADALEAALAAGLDPEAEPARLGVPAGRGELLVMPAAVGPHATVKLVSIGGDPRIQGLCVVFDTQTLAPVALLDGVALTNLRTPATSLVAARRLAPPDPRRLVVFGAGPQARAHAEAFQAEFAGLDAVTVLHRASSRREIEQAAGRADVICCATTAREPLFDGARVRDGALVIAIGSHEPAAREVDERLVQRATVVVESRRSALREAGDLIAAGVHAAELVTLAELVAGRQVPGDRPRLFKSTGMSWEDTVVASAVLDAIGGAPVPKGLSH